MLFYDLDIIRRGEAEFLVYTDQGPVGIRGVVDHQLRVFREGYLLVCLACVVIEGFRLADRFGLNQASLARQSIRLYIKSN